MRKEAPVHFWFGPSRSNRSEHVFDMVLMVLCWRDKGNIVPQPYGGATYERSAVTCKDCLESMAKEELLFQENVDRLDEVLRMHQDSFNEIANPDSRPLVMSLQDVRNTIDAIRKRPWR